MRRAGLSDRLQNVSGRKAGLVVFGVDRALAVVHDTRMKTTLRTGYLVKARSIAELSASNESYLSAFFSSEAEAREFTARLPKFCKAVCHQLSSGCPQEDPNEFGLRWVPVSEGSKVLGAWNVSMKIKGLSRVTGATNELGEKRRAAFLKALEGLEVVEAL